MLIIPYNMVIFWSGCSCNHNVDVNHLDDLMRITPLLTVLTVLNVLWIISIVAVHMHLNYTCIQAL